MALNLNEQVGGSNLQNMSKHSTGFIQHVTRFDTETKSELSNLLQYLVIVIVPIGYVSTEEDADNRATV